MFAERKTESSWGLYKAPSLIQSFIEIMEHTVC